VVLMMLGPDAQTLVKHGLDRFQSRLPMLPAWLSPTRQHLFIPSPNTKTKPESFASQGPTLMARLIEPKGGLETLGNALGLMYVKSEELVEKDNTAYLEVVHMTVAVMYNTLLLYEQVRLDWNASLSLT